MSLENIHEFSEESLRLVETCDMAKLGRKNFIPSLSRPIELSDEEQAMVKDLALGRVTLRIPDPK